MTIDRDDNGRSNRWQLDKRISITHMFATASAIAALIGFGANLNTRLTLIEQYITQSNSEQVRIDARQDAARDDLRRETRENYKAISDKLDRLIERTTK